MPYYLRYFSEKSVALIASSKRGNFLSQQKEQAGLLLITLSVVYVTVFFVCRRPYLVIGLPGSIASSVLMAVGLLSDFLQPQMLPALISQCLGHNQWDEGEWVLTEFRQ